MGSSGEGGSLPENRTRTERAILAALQTPSQRRWETLDSLAELGQLAESAGARVVGTLIQQREARSPSLYFGKGKVEELRELARAGEADLLISDDGLSPIQERNLEQTLKLKVIDRTALILDIFAQRARTSAGKLQVELAQLTYLLPRLVGQWKHLERLGGGIGTRGPGETQLESDRRIIRRRILQTKKELDHVQTHRRLLRTRRRATGFPVVALVGYTNAGKTTLFNQLAGSQLPAANQLFVTLDPAARLITPPDHQPFMLTDTVGFIRKLPPQLVSAFKATLEELHEADVLLHVADASHPGVQEQLAVVERLLGELGLRDRPSILVLNKVDQVDGGNGLRALVEEFRGTPLCALSGAGISELLSRIGLALRVRVGHATLRIPYADGPTLALCYERGRVLRRADEPTGIRIEVELPIPLLGAVSGYRIETP
ncbi:MAG: GTPase HflX [Candidatus Methylomirabilia bacterium]